MADKWRGRDRYDCSRRQFLKSTAAAGALVGVGSLLPGYARADGGSTAGTSPVTNEVDLYVRRQAIRIGGRSGSAITINGTVPAPLVRLQEGAEAVLRVHNELEESTSIHWHGIILPFEMDGVPGVSYPGIGAGEMFTYRFPVTQSGTYWYHSHTGLQEQLGHYGPLVIDPAGGDSHPYDREHVIILSDWTFENPYKVMAKLKKMSSYYNFSKRTVGDLLSDVGDRGLGDTVNDRLSWGAMRMAPTDIADITGHTLTYLVNGLAPETNWTGLFKPGERVRLRLINAAPMTYFNVRIPGLPMTVVQADGQDVVAVEADELQIAVAETYDVIVTPTEDRAYTVFAEAMDRSGFGRGTLAPREGMTGPVPELREPPTRTMIDMGMDMGGMGTEGSGMTHAVHGGGDHGAMSMGTEKAGPVVGRHGKDSHGPGNLSVATVQRNRLAEPGTGLEGVPHRVLVYTDLVRLADDFDPRLPEREVELHLTGHMERYMWSFDGKKFSEVNGPIEFVHGERLRLTLVNDTMMEHPIHLHGMWMELENGRGNRIPRKHTINVKPAERLSALISADEPGRWAFHCHLLYHMEMGMFRVVRVS